VLSVVVSLILLPRLVDKLGVAGAIVFIVCLPVTVLFNGWLNTANPWAVRWRQFNQVAANEFIRVTGTMGVQILTGFVKAGGVGLMTGQACGTALAYFAMTWRGTLGELRARAKRTSWRRMRLVAWSYRDFALFQTPKAAISVSSRNLPPILLGALYDATITGLFYFAFRLTLLPANLLNVSVGRVLMQRFATMRQEKRVASALLIRATLLILAPSLLLVTVLWFLGPPGLRVLPGRFMARGGRAGRLGRAVVRQHHHRQSGGAISDRQPAQRIAVRARACLPAPSFPALSLFRRTGGWGDRDHLVLRGLVALQPRYCRCGDRRFAPGRSGAKAGNRLASVTRWRSGCSRPFDSC